MATQAQGPAVKPQHDSAGYGSEISRWKMCLRSASKPTRKKGRRLRLIGSYGCTGNYSIFELAAWRDVWWQALTHHSGTTADTRCGVTWDREAVCAVRAGLSVSTWAGLMEKDHRPGRWSTIAAEEIRRYHLRNDV